jgi:hypothetical protein
VGDSVLSVLKLYEVLHNSVIKSTRRCMAVFSSP